MSSEAVSPADSALSCEGLVVSEKATENRRTPCRGGGKRRRIHWRRQPKPARFWTTPALSQRARQCHQWGRCHLQAVRLQYRGRCARVVFTQSGAVRGGGALQFPGGLGCSNLYGSRGHVLNRTSPASARRFMKMTPRRTARRCCGSSRSSSAAAGTRGPGAAFNCCCTPSGSLGSGGGQRHVITMPRHHQVTMSLARPTSALGSDQDSCWSASWRPGRRRNRPRKASCAVGGGGGGGCHCSVPAGVGGGALR